jgi:hypothetical protein
MGGLVQGVEGREGERRGEEFNYMIREDDLLCRVGILGFVGSF